VKFVSFAHGFMYNAPLSGTAAYSLDVSIGYIESAEQSRTAEHFWLAAYSASKSDNKPV